MSVLQYYAQVLSRPGAHRARLPAILHHFRDEIQHPFRSLRAENVRLVVGDSLKHLVGAVRGIGGQQLVQCRHCLSACVGVGSRVGDGLRVYLESREGIVDGGAAAHHLQQHLVQVRIVHAHGDFGVDVHHLLERGLDELEPLRNVLQALVHLFAELGHRVRIRVASGQDSEVVHKGIDPRAEQLRRVSAQHRFRCGICEV